jgi:hypothetical protein
MDRNKFDIVLDLYKKDQITKDEAYTLMKEPDPQIQLVPYENPQKDLICPRPWSPYDPLNPYGPTISYGSNRPSFDPTAPVTARSTTYENSSVTDGKLHNPSTIE